MTKFELVIALMNTEKHLTKIKEETNTHLEKTIFAALQVFCNTLASELMKR